MTLPPLPQGDLGLLDSDTAKRLLASGIPARFAYLAWTAPHASSRPGSTGPATSW